MVDANTAHLEIAGLNKFFGSFQALKDISLEVSEAEFVCFLGPSGCGKTTLLRAIAGLDFQTDGSIVQRGMDISHLPPAGRDFGIVFQSYALFPNLSVRKNVSYGLDNTGMPKDKVLERVAQLLELVGLPDQADKYPAKLSGGQQQRVALARALATSPALLLLDEPLSALDAKVRVRLRHEIKSLQRRLGVTTIMVTHDQEEALTMADRIVVMNEGVIEQIGTPREIYRQPASEFVAGFIGTMNFLPGAVQHSGLVRVGGNEIECDTGDTADGAGVVVSFRPEHAELRPPGQGQLGGRIENIDFLGPMVRLEILVGEADGGSVFVDAGADWNPDFPIDPGRDASLYVEPGNIRLFSRDG